MGNLVSAGEAEDRSRRDAENTCDIASGQRTRVATDLLDYVICFERNTRCSARVFCKLLIVNDRKDDGGE